MTTSEESIRIEVISDDDGQRQEQSKDQVKAEIVSMTDSASVLVKPQQQKQQQSPQSYKTVYVYALVIYAALGALFFGYVMAVFNPARNYIEAHAFSSRVSGLLLNLMTSLVPVGAGVGALSAGKIASSIGRRKSMIIFDIIAIAATALTVLPHPVVMLIGRLVQGYCVGANSSVVSLYISEVSPREAAGKLGTFNQLLITIGILIAPVLGLGLPTGNGDSDPNSQFWRVMLLVAAVPPLLRLVLSYTVFNFDTPKYLVSIGNEIRARHVLGKIYKGTRADDELLRMKEEKELELQRGKLTLAQVFSPKYKKRLLSAILVAVFQQLSGVNAMIFFSNDIFALGTSSNTNLPTIYTIIMGVIQIAATFVAGRIIERLGRKLLFFVGMGFATVICAAFGVVGVLDGDSPILKFLIWGYIIGFGLSLGPIPWVYISDILPDVALGFAVLSNWAATFVIGIGFPYIAEYWGMPTGFFIFAGCSLIGTIFVLFFVKETKGKSEAEITAMFWKGAKTSVKQPATQVSV